MAQISLCGKLQVDVEMKASAAKFHELLSSRTHELSEACPGKVSSVNLLEGQWGQLGSVLCWTYVPLSGKPESNKVRVESIDSKNKSYSFSVSEGPLLEYYKSFKVSFQATAFGEHSIVCYTFEYEKMNENVPDPNAILDLTVSCVKDIDAYLNKA